MSLETAKKSDTEHSGVADRDVKKYLRSVKKLLHCPRTQRNEFLRQLETNIYFYISENEVENMEKVKEEFGSAEEMAQSFLEECNAKTVSKSIKANRRVSVALILIALIATISVVSILLANYIDRYNYRHGYYVDTIGYGSPTPPPENTFIAGID